MCEDKLEFKSQRNKPILLAEPHFASNRVKFIINRALLSVEQWE